MSIEENGFNPEKNRSPEDKFWTTYLDAARDEDEARPKDWDGNTGSILTFIGLFAATVAAFVIESYQSLSPDPGEQTVILLTRILAASTNASAPVPASTSSDLFKAPTAAVITNALWFSSLLVSLVCALLATLVQQWSRDYVRDIRRRQTLDESVRARAFNHIYIRMGIDSYGMDEVVNLLVTLVHVAVMLFVAGLLLFLFPINFIVAWCTASLICAFGAVYLNASMLPLFDKSCPYKTPLTNVLRVPYWFLRRTILGQALIVYGVFLRYGINMLLTLAPFFMDVAGLRPNRSMAMTSLRVEIATARPWFMRHGRDWLRLSENLSLQDVIARQWNRRYYYGVHSDSFQFLSDASLRFGFAWKHTSRHLASASFEVLLHSTIGIIMESSVIHRCRAQECLSYLHRDDSFLDQLRFSASRATSHAGTSPDCNTQLLALQTLSLLCQSVFKDEILGNSAGKPPLGLALSSYLKAVLRSIAQLPIDSPDESGTVLMKRFSLFYVRSALLHLCKRASELGVKELTENEVATYFWSDWDRIYLDLKNVGHPCGVLLLLNSPEHNTLDSRRDTSLNHVPHSDISTCLIPLHNSICCRTQAPSLVSDFWPHVAACNALGMIYRLLHASEAERAHVFDDDVGRRFDSLWQLGNPFRDSIDPKVLPMRETAVLPAPSSAFMSILQSAGLGTWLEPHSDFSSGPPDVPHLRFLTRQPPGVTFVDWTLLDILRGLARQVDFSAPRPDAQNLPPLPIVHSVEHESLPSLQTSGSPTDAPLRGCPVAPALKAAFPPLQSVIVTNTDVITEDNTIH